VSPATRALPIFLLGFVRKTAESLRDTYATSCKRLVIDEAPRGAGTVHLPMMPRDLYEANN